MSDIPSEILLEMLLRLPAKSLFRFRTVCKAWRRIIDDPSFIKSHNNNQHSDTTLFIRTSTGTLYSLSLDSLNYTNGQQTIDVTHVKNVVRQGVPRLPAFPVASCHGLILISHYDIKKIWVIWNPLTGEFHELPQPDIDVRLIGSGLGYDSVSDDYKVVRIDEMCRNGKVVYQTFVYSLKLNSWKMIRDCPCDFSWGSQGVFLNGALHWISWDMIIALDLAVEDYRQLPLPSVRLPVDKRLDALGGCLILSDAYAMKRAWVMKDYGVENSWMDLFSSRERDSMGGLGYLWPIAYLKSKGQLIMQHDSNIICWDIDKSCAKKVTIHGLPDFLSSQICPGSLFRLDDNCCVGGSVAAKRTAGVKRKRKKANTSPDGVWKRPPQGVLRVDVDACFNEKENPHTVGGIVQR
ncbi:hypothetical protein DH2020_030658 [Rehmannia glutinosa]|uniref:F-box domain-containing protein n=1 Tax=Rehmannia glutinosa TaxID=99300 RepID=A0ABR0VPA4_REHGL